MSEMIGTQLGPYKITGKLGEGGMGEVWRASDHRLKRDVAIKVLPEGFVKDPERLARFEREAQLLAQLNHPNIAQVYGLESKGTTRALVMELVEGPTLAERLQAGPLPLEESLAIARQIAEALEEAHDKGIIHRDLKPQNIKAAVDGKVKVLDFGLAKALDPAPTGPEAQTQSNLSHSPTLTLEATRQGVILGTAAYMSPEQAKGMPVDKRSDVWSFGVVFYEMLAGKRLFEGPTASETLALVLTRAPELESLPAGTPPAVRTLIGHCLARNPKDRLHDIADVRILLETAGERSPTGQQPATLSRNIHPLWLATGLVVIGLAWMVGYFMSRSAPQPAAEPKRLSLQLGPDQLTKVGGNSLLTFSPDGRSLVLVGYEHGKQLLFRRDLGGGEVVAIPGTEEGEEPFFSPDGKSIGFAMGGKLMKVDVAGGRPLAMGSVRGAGGATWLSDDTLVYAPIYTEGLFRIPIEGGSPERLTTPDRASGVLGHWWPQPLPAEKKIVFTAFRTPTDQSRIGVVDLETGKIDWVVDGGYFARYVGTGHLIYCRDQRLFALPFDPVTVRATGPAEAVLNDVQTLPIDGIAMFDVSFDGTLAYMSETLGNPARELVWLDRAGNISEILPERQRFMSLDLSPDGRKVALTLEGESLDLWTLSLERGTLSRLTSGEKTEFAAVWSPDSKEIFYVLDRPPFELQRMLENLPDSGRPIWDEPAELDLKDVTVSPDGRTVAFTILNNETGEDLYFRPLDGSEPPSVIRATRSEENFPSFSPDGRWIAYQSDETGRSEVYVQGFPEPGERVQVSADGGAEPVWARNGEIFYRHFDDIRAVTVRFGGKLEVGLSKDLFTLSRLRKANNSNARVFAVAPDGQRVLAILTPENDQPRQVEIVTDWDAELLRLAPASAGR